MKLLLDTQIAYWWLYDSARISDSLRRLVIDEADAVHISLVSLWELSVKRAAGTLRLDIPRFAEQIERDGFEWQPITREHLLAADALPAVGDSFDRLLVAQAIAERMTLVTADRTLEPYGAAVRLVELSP